MSESHSIHPHQSPESSLNLENLPLKAPETSLTSDDGDMTELFNLFNNAEDENASDNGEIEIEEAEIREISAKNPSKNELEVGQPEMSSEISLETESEAETTEIETQTDSEPENQTNWFDLACKLKKQNQELIQTVVTLEQALAQARHDIQEQQRLSKQLAQYSLEPQLVTPSQGEKSIQAFEIETLSQKVKELQAQMAQLERECAVLKEECQDKSHQLATAERHIRELHSRLQRQQRYTLQYKAALEQQLGETLEDPLDMTSDPAIQNIPIQPWSGQIVASDSINPSEDSPNSPEPSSSEELPTRSPSFRVNLSKVANQYGAPTPPKSRPKHEIIDLPAFLRRRSS